MLNVVNQDLGLTPEDFVERDLMLSCDAPPTVGEIVFCVLGRYRFVSLPEIIYVIDGSGADLIAAGRIKLGKPRLTDRGDLAIPVVSVSDNLPRMAVFVRGVRTEFPANADPEGLHGYAIGGSAVRHLQSMVCIMAEESRFLSNWEEVPWEPRWRLGAVQATVKGSDHPVLLGEPLDCVVGGDSEGGYVPAIVLEGTEPNAIRDGSILIRCLPGMRFKADAATKLYLVDAASGECIHEHISARMTVTEDGDLSIRLENLASQRLKVVIAAPLVEISEPVQAGTGRDIGISGSALGSPLFTTTALIIGAASSESPSGLAKKAIEIADWQPVAAVK